MPGFSPEQTDSITATWKKRKWDHEEPRTLAPEQHMSHPAESIGPNTTVAAHCLYHDTQTEQTSPSDHAASLESADMFKALILHYHPTNININSSTHINSNTNNPQSTSPQTSTAPQTKTHTHPRSPPKPSSPCTTQRNNPPPPPRSAPATSAIAAQQPAKYSTPTQIVISATNGHASSVSGNAIAHPAAERSVCQKRKVCSRCAVEEVTETGAEIVRCLDCVRGAGSWAAANIPSDWALDDMRHEDMTG
ncbi:hypothetical protein LT330_008636 [Penicillium expansum]|nr:hypothetical protein LT330_008636 [Penicillium expansum]